MYFLLTNGMRHYTEKALNINLFYIRLLHFQCDKTFKKIMFRIITQTGNQNLENARMHSIKNIRLELKM